MQTPTATPTVKIPASLIKRYNALMSFSPRQASFAANLRNDKAWKKLAEDCKARGITVNDLSYRLAIRCMMHAMPPFAHLSFRSE